MTVGRGSGSVTAAEQAADGFGDPVDGLADNRFGPGDAVHDAFGGLRDAGFFERAPEQAFVDPADRAVYVNQLVDARRAFANTTRFGDALAMFLPKR